MDEAEITELYDLEVDRHDGVASPASGFSFLVTKSVAKADSDGDGSDDTDDQGIFGDDKPADAETSMERVKSCLACGSMNCGVAVKDAEFMKAHRHFGADERKRLAGKGHALPDGSYPIPDEDALHRAAILARSGHGDVKAAKALIARRAKELGVKNPLSESAQKTMDENTETSEAEVTKTEAEVAPALTVESVQELVKAALAERDSAAEERATKAEADVATLKSELDVLKATPIPGGPVISATADQRAFKAKNEAIQKAAYFKRLAETVNDRELAVEYTRRAKAAEAEAA